MTKINGTQIIEASDTATEGYRRFSGALVSAACNFFFQRHGRPTTCDFPTHRYPCGKKRPEGPVIVRVKLANLSRAAKDEVRRGDRTELSRAKRRDNGALTDGGRAHPNE